VWFRRIDVSEFAPYALTVGVVVLAWHMAAQPIMQRAPVEVAIRIAPESPLVLRRAAEAELAAGRTDNAAALGREALHHSPFDVRALRVVGLTEARAERLGRADEILTLAGNWSLRDDPAHAWLVEYRLRRGDYASAFAHADTLARRREDIHPQLFHLFTVAAAEDPQRVLPVLTRLLAARPPWRSTFLSSLYDADGGLQVVANLAILLQSSRAPFARVELQEFYGQMMGRGQIETIKTVRARLNRPRTDAAVTNGGFDDQAAPEPFQWTLIQKAGAVAQVLADDTDKGNPALRVEYDGYSTANIARQQTFLSGGRYRLRSQSRTEAGEPVGRMEWTVTCAVRGETLASAPAVPTTGAGKNEWVNSTVDFSVSSACPTQWLELRGLPLDRRAPMVVWFDQVTIIPLDSTRNLR
jgi:hypothetical protein